MQLRHRILITFVIGLIFVSLLYGQLIAECNYGYQVVIEGQAQDQFYYEFQNNQSAVMYHTLWSNNLVPADPGPNAWKRGEGESVCPATVQTPGEASVTEVDPKNWTA
jgi:hypothetical protein